MSDEIEGKIARAILKFVWREEEPSQECIEHFAGCEGRAVLAMLDEEGYVLVRRDQ